MKNFVLLPAPHPSRANCIAAVSAAPDGYLVSFRPAKQSDIQRDKYHAMLGDIAKQEPIFTAEIWKRALVDQFKSETLKDPQLAKYWERNKIQMMPSLDGQRVIVLGEQVRDFPMYVASHFIEFLYAWGADKDIKWKEPPHDDKR